MSENVYEVTRREIPELGDDQAVLALFASSIDSNVTTCLQIMQHQIDLAGVHAPAAALEEARRRAQRGTPLTALLRAYRLGHTVFLDWVFRELARQSHDDARMLTAVTMDLSKIVAGYVDQTSEEIVATYARERENWLRNRSAARAARIRDLLSGQLIDVSATEATLGYRLRQHHLGVVCWTGAEAARPTTSPGLSGRSATSPRRRRRAPTRSSCPATSRAPGPGSRSGSGTGSTPPRPARPTSTATSMSRSATWSRASPGSASPTSRPSPPRRSRWRADPRPGW